MESSDLAALSLVSKRWLQLSNHAKESLDTSAFPTELHNKLFEQMLARFNNLRTLLWGQTSSRGMEEEEKLAGTGLAALIKVKATRLTSLNIASSSIILDPQILETLLCGLPQLASLSLYGKSCSQLSQANALAIVGGACPLLKAFSFRSESHFRGAKDLSKAEAQVAVRQFAAGCPLVRSLTLVDFDHVALASTKELLKVCTGLEEVHLEQPLTAGGERVILEGLARSCPRLTSLALGLELTEDTTVGVLADVLPSFNWPGLKVLKITLPVRSESSVYMKAWELEEAIWHAFQSRHPLMEECMIAGLVVRGRFIADSPTGRCWEHLKKVGFGWLYMTSGIDFTTTLSALQRDCPLLEEVTLQLDEGTNCEWGWDSSTLPPLPSVTALHLSGGGSDQEDLFARELNLGACFPSLRHLDIGVFCTFTRAGHPRSYFEGLGQLESLSLMGVEENVFGEVSVHCPYLQKLVISHHNFKGSDYYFEGDFERLQRFELHEVDLDETNARMIAKGCPRLRHLVFAQRWPHPDGIKRLLIDCENLRHVAISGSYDDDIKPSLQRLTRSGCLVVTRQGKDVFSI